MQSYSNEKMAFSEHFSELYKIIRVSAFGVVIISFFLSFLIDDILTNWLESLSLGQTPFARRAPKRKRPSGQTGYGNVFQALDRGPNAKGER